MRMMKKALTTAELLVALTIVGVIATLVLPVLIHDYYNKIYVSKLKKTYNLLTNAIEQACVDNSVSNFGLTEYARSGKEENFIERYFPVSRKENAFADKYRKITQTTYNLAANYKVQNTTYTPYSLRGGQAVYMKCATNFAGTETFKRCYFIVDINGKDSPNQAGRDIFTFLINQTTNNVYDYSDTNDTNCKNNSRSIALPDVTLNLNGAGCFYRILSNNWTMKY